MTHNTSKAKHPQRRNALTCDHLLEWPKDLNDARAPRITRPRCTWKRTEPNKQILFFFSRLWQLYFVNIYISVKDHHFFRGRYYEMYLYKTLPSRQCIDPMQTKINAVINNAFAMQSVPFSFFLLTWLYAIPERSSLLVPSQQDIYAFNWKNAWLQTNTVFFFFCIYMYFHYYARWRYLLIRYKNGAFFAYQYPIRYSPIGTQDAFF